MKRRSFIGVSVLAVALLVSAVVLYGQPLISYIKIAAHRADFVPRVADDSSPQASTRRFTLPADGFYRIVQAEEIWPKIIEATIYPPDVHVGDIQKLTVVVESPEPIASVTATLKLDHETKVLSLKPKAASTGEGADPLVSRYETEWKVYDTHETFYKTTFTAKDAKGQESSVTIAWSDVCGITNDGDWTMLGNCTIASTDGVDNGNATLGSGTLTLDATFAFNAGKSMTVSTGASIAFGASGQLVKTNLWKQDSDGDSYPNVAQLAQDNAQGGYTRRYTWVKADDCNEVNAGYFQWVSDVARDRDQDGYYTGGAVTICASAGTTLSARDYFRDDVNNYYHVTLDTALGAGDSNDTNGAVH